MFVHGKCMRVASHHMELPTFWDRILCAITLQAGRRGSKKSRL